MEQLAIAGVRLVRLGHPARVTQLTQKHTLDALLHHRLVSVCLQYLFILKYCFIIASFSLFALLILNNLNKL